MDAQRSPQFTPSQVVVVPLPIGPSGHTEHRLPQVATEKFETHWPLHSWKPTLHAIPQLVPLQLAVPFTGTGHGVHEVPHDDSAVSETQAELHRWKPVAQVYWHWPLTHCGFVAPAGGVQV